MAACIYIRISNQAHTQSSLMIGRIKVASFNQESLPMHKEQTAAIDARLCKFTTGEFRLNFNAIHFWTDSTTVFAWINSPEKQKSYFADRNNRMLSFSEVQQWHQIPGKRNQADHATRSIPLQDVEQLWLQPPELLLFPESDGPQPKLQDDTVTQPVFTTTDKEITTTLKVDNAILHTNAMVKSENILSSAKREPIIDLSRFSDWLSLLCATVCVVQLKDVLQQKRKRDSRIDDRFKPFHGWCTCAALRWPGL